MCFRPPTAKKAEKKCPKCGTMNPLDAENCINCGEQLPEAPPPPGVSAAAPRPGAPPKGPPPPPKAPPSPPKVPPTKKPDEK